MTLPINSVVNVSISSTPTPLARAGFGTLMGITNETGVIDKATRIKYYASATEVQTDFPTNEAGSGPSEIGKMALTYFSQRPAPTTFAVGMIYESFQTSTLYSTKNLDDLNILSVLAEQTFGFTLSVNFNGGTSNITEEYQVTFQAGITTPTEMVDDIQAAIDAVGTQDVTFTFNASTNKIEVEYGGGVTAGDNIDYLTPPSVGTDLLPFIGGDQANAYKNSAFDAENFSSALTALYNTSDLWYGFAFVKRYTDGITLNTETLVDAAKWAEGAESPKLFFNQSFNDATVDVTPANQTTISSLLSGVYDRTLNDYCSDGISYGAVSAAGFMFTWNPAAINSHYTLKFKDMPTIPTEDLNTGQKANMDGVNCNAVVNVAGQSIFAEGVMASGIYADRIHALDWLENSLETAVFNYLKGATSKRPASQVGQSGIDQAIRGVFEEAVINGFLGAGFDLEGNYYPLGYQINVPFLTTAEKQARTSNGITFIAIGTGALHGAIIRGVYEE